MLSASDDNLLVLMPGNTIKEPGSGGGGVLRYGLPDVGGLAGLHISDEAPDNDGDPNVAGEGDTSLASSIFGSVRLVGNFGGFENVTTHASEKGSGGYMGSGVDSEAFLADIEQATRPSTKLTQQEIKEVSR